MTIVFPGDINPMPAPEGAIIKQYKQKQSETYSETREGNPECCLCWCVLTDRDAIKTDIRFDDRTIWLLELQLFIGTPPFAFVLYPHKLDITRKGDCGRDRALWEVKICYRNIVAGDADEDEYEQVFDPCLRTVRCSFSDRTVRLTATHDALGNPFINKACDMMEGNARLASERVYSMCKNYCEEPEWPCFYGDTTNSDFVVLRGKIWAPNTLLLTNIRCSGLQTENGIQFVEICWDLIGRGFGWHRVVPNIGYNEKKYLDVGGNEVDKDSEFLIRTIKCAILDANGENLSSPAFLDNCGRAIPVPPGQLLGLLAVQDTPSGQIFLTNFEMTEEYLGTTVIVKDPDNGSSPIELTISTLTGLAGDPPVSMQGTLYGDTSALTPLRQYQVCASGITTCTFQDYPLRPFNGIVPLCEDVFDAALETELATEAEMLEFARIPATEKMAARRKRKADRFIEAAEAGRIVGLRKNAIDEEVKRLTLEVSKA